MNGLRRCEGCGCTDTDACVDPEGQVCYWLDSYRGNLCSACARLLLAISPELHSEMLDSGNRAMMRASLERGPREPMVEVFGESDLDLAIRERRRERACPL